MDKRAFARTWLSFTVLQLLGNLWQCTDTKTFSVKMFREHAWKQISPIVSRLFFLHNLILLLLRMLLIICFQSRSLHIFHLVCSVVSMLYLAMEAFYFMSLDSSVPVISQVVLSGISVVIILVCKSSIWESVDKRSTKCDKRRMLVSKHFLTNNQFDDSPISPGAMNLKKLQ